jgi:pimeloyl-ACP methyl ester carboxylesterase
VTFTEEVVTTRRDVTTPVRLYGSDSDPTLVWLHGAGGLFPTEPALDALAESYHVVAPVWPGYSEHADEEKLEDMLDFALHGWDVIAALGIERPHLAGHSMGGMIAAEMAALAPHAVDRLVLVSSAGLWLDAHPVPDIFAMLPFELAEVLFADPAVGEKILTGGLDFDDDSALTTLMVARARQLGMAGKILFPVPNRRLSKRLYRIANPTLLVWGAEDRLVPPVYGEAFEAALDDARLVLVDDAGHMITVEQPAALADEIAAFLGAGAG